MGIFSNLFNGSSGTYPLTSGALGESTAVASGDSGSVGERFGAWLGNIFSFGGESRNALYAENAATENAYQAALSREFDALENEKNRAFNAAEAEKERQWSERMRKTAYQDTVADLKAAGLSAALMYGNGSGVTAASTGASASSGGVSTSRAAGASAITAANAADIGAKLLSAGAAIVRAAALKQSANTAAAKLALENS